jgi:hypothetical protein
MLVVIDPGEIVPDRERDLARESPAAAINLQLTVTAGGNEPELR